MTQATIERLKGSVQNSLASDHAKPSNYFHKLSFYKAGDASNRTLLDQLHTRVKGGEDVF